MNPVVIIDGVPMGNRIIFKFNEGNGQMTVPPMDFRSDDEQIKIATVLRECCSNAENFGATKAVTVMLYAFGHSWLFFMHNGKPFKDLVNDILALGCRPFISSFEGKAFQGNGLTASAYGVHPNFPLLLIASNTEKEGFKVGTGCPSESNEWHQFDATEVWKPVLGKLLGPNLMKDYSVFYGFKFDLRETKQNARRFLNGKLMNTLAMMAPSILGDGESTPGKLNLIYSEKEIGYPYTKESDKKYATYESSKAAGGSARRYTKSFQGLVARYVGKGPGGTWKDGHFEISCKPFEIFDPVRKETLLIKEATLHINFFPAVKNPDREAHGRHYHTVLRDGNIDGKFTAGAQWEYGIQPSTKVFLMIPWIYDYYFNTHPEDAHRFERFKDNSLGLYDRPRNIMSILNCPYNDKGDDESSGEPYVTIHVSIDEVEGVVRRKEKQPATAKTIFDIFGRRSDFTFSRYDMIRHIVNEAAKAVPPKDATLKQLKELCSQYFKIDENIFYEIPLSDEMGGSEYEKELTHNNNVVFYDLAASKEAGQPVVFDGVFTPNQSIRLLAWHKVLGGGRLLAPDEVVPQGLTHGLEIKSADDFGFEETVEMIIEALNQEKLAVAAELRKDSENEEE